MSLRNSVMMALKSFLTVPTYAGGGERENVGAGSNLINYITMNKVIMMYEDLYRVTPTI